MNIIKQVNKECESVRALIESNQDRLSYKEIEQLDLVDESVGFWLDRELYSRVLWECQNARAILSNITKF